MIKTKKFEITELKAELHNSRIENKNLRSELKVLKDAVECQLDKTVVRCKNCMYGTVLNFFDSAIELEIGDTEHSCIACGINCPAYTLVEPEHYCRKGYSGKGGLYKVLLCNTTNTKCE